MIVGADDRVEVTSTTGAHNFPWRTVGHIKTGCSGALVHSYTVLSAGHCEQGGRGWREWRVGSGWAPPSRALGRRWGASAQRAAMHVRLR